VDAQKVGKRIAKLRKQRNITQQQLADELSVTDKAVSKWETGSGLPDIAIMPELASTLGVCVEEIISDDSLSSESTILIRSLTAWLKTKTARIIAVVMLAAFLLGFGVYNLLWFRYMDIAYSPFFRNEKLTSFTIEWDGRKFTVFEFFDEETNYYIEIVKPRYLQFKGIIIASISTANFIPEPDSFKGNIHIVHTGKLRVQQILVLDVGEWLGYPDFSRTYGATIDKHGNPVGWHPPGDDIDLSFLRYPVDSDFLYNIWLSLFNKHYIDAIALLEYTKEFFGADAFWEEGS
jgi:transcriptional regulator with XRE-family HTH domain